MKSGTTSLYYNLCEHPQLIYSSVKEPSFFSWKYNIGIKKYLSCFPPKKDVNNHLVFEASITYLHAPSAAKRIKKVIPKVKLIAILRDPIERAVSHYNFYSNLSSDWVKYHPQDRDKREIDQAFLQDIRGEEKQLNKQYCRFGLYGLQLERYYKRFDPKNILIIDFEELKQDAKKTLIKTSEFLKIDTSFFQSFIETKEKAKRKDFFESNENNKIKIFNSENYSINLSADMQNRLIEFYKEDVKKLQKLTGLTFSWSNKYLR